MLAVKHSALSIEHLVLSIKRSAFNFQHVALSMSVER
jgi:hypothetical protein